MGLGYGHMQVIDINEYVAQAEQKWVNYTLCPINNSLVRLGIFEGEFHWHHHDMEDELFFVISGWLYLDLKDRTVELMPNQGFAVPKGVEHRTRAKERTIVLMVEGDTVDPKGD